MNGAFSGILAEGVRWAGYGGFSLGDSINVFDPEWDGDYAVSSFATKKTKNFTPYKSMVFTFLLKRTNAGEDGKRANISVFEHRENTRHVRIGFGEFVLRSVNNIVGTKIITTVPLSGASNGQQGIYIKFRAPRQNNFDISISQIDFTV